jgi:hypothetical protein
MKLDLELIQPWNTVLHYLDFDALPPKTQCKRIVDALRLDTAVYDMFHDIFVH